MNKLSQNYTQEELDKALKYVGAEISDRGGELWDIWVDDKYGGTFGSMEAVIEDINDQIESKNYEKQCDLDEHNKLVKALEGAIEAVVLNDFDKPIYKVNTNEKCGGHIAFAGAVSNDGTLCNVSYLRISRNKKYLKQELDYLTAKLDNYDELYYSE